MGKIIIKFFDTPQLAAGWFIFPGTRIRDGTNVTESAQRLVLYFHGETR